MPATFAAGLLRDPGRCAYPNLPLPNLLSLTENKRRTEAPIADLEQKLGLRA